MKSSKSDPLKTIQLVFKIILGAYTLLFFYMLFSLVTYVHCGPSIDVVSQEKLTLFSYTQELNILILLFIDGFIFLVALYVVMVILSKRNKTGKKHGKFLLSLVVVFMIFVFGLIPISSAIRSIIPTDSSEYCSLSVR